MNFLDRYECLRSKAFQVRKEMIALDHNIGDWDVEIIWGNICGRPCIRVIKNCYCVINFTVDSHNCLELTDTNHKNKKEVKRIQKAVGEWIKGDFT